MLLLRTLRQREQGAMVMIARLGASSSSAIQPQKNNNTPAKTKTSTVATRRFLAGGAPDQRGVLLTNLRLCGQAMRLALVEPLTEEDFPGDFLIVRRWHATRGEARSLACHQPETLPVSGFQATNDATGVRLVQRAPMLGVSSGGVTPEAYIELDWLVSEAILHVTVPVGGQSDVYRLQARFRTPQTSTLDMRWRFEPHGSHVGGGGLLTVCISDVASLRDLHRHAPLVREAASLAFAYAWLVHRLAAAAPGRIELSGAFVSQDAQRLHASSALIGLRGLDHDDDNDNNDKGPRLDLFAHDQSVDVYVSPVVFALSGRDPEADVPPGFTALRLRGAEGQRDDGHVIYRMEFTRHTDAEPVVRAVCHWLLFASPPPPSLPILTAAEAAAAVSSRAADIHHPPQELQGAQA